MLWAATAAGSYQRPDSRALRHARNTLSSVSPRTGMMTQRAQCAGTFMALTHRALRAVQGHPASQSSTTASACIASWGGPKRVTTATTSVISHGCAFVTTGSTPSLKRLCYSRSERTFTTAVSTDHHCSCPEYVERITAGRSLNSLPGPSACLRQISQAPGSLTLHKIYMRSGLSLVTWERIESSQTSR